MTLEEKLRDIAKTSTVESLKEYWRQSIVLKGEI